LFQRGARTFKFVDRTFNLNIKTSLAILTFFLDRMVPSLFVHFEMVPDRFPPALREIVKQFPVGSLQLEIGVQSLNSNTGKLISRRQDVAKLFDNLRFLREQTSAHLHVDLIAGLPGEDIQSFGSGFDTLVACNPQEIQVGILKKLRGTPISRHADEYRLSFSDFPPYEVVSTRDVSFEDLQRIGRFARYWDLVGNSGNFLEARPLVLATQCSPFVSFMHFSDWLFKKLGRRSAIQLKTLTEQLFFYLIEQYPAQRDQIGCALVRDYQRPGRSDLPEALKVYRSSEADGDRSAPLPVTLKRQRRAAAQ
jgi:hypothetical protein